MPGGEISLHTHIHPRRFWIMVPVRLAGRLEVDAVLDTGSPASAVSPALAEILVQHGMAEWRLDQRFVSLSQLSVGRLSLPRYPMAVLQRLSAVETDAVLGLDFLRHFEEVRFHLASLRLTLLDP